MIEDSSSGICVECLAKRVVRAMKIVVAPDSFKGSLTAVEACRAISAGVGRVVPQAQIVEIPMADGGEGTVDALVASTAGQRRHVVVRGPLSEKVDAVYGILGDAVGPDEGEKTAVIEMAAAAGLTLVPVEKRNPLYTTTFGLGQLILDAVEHRCRNIVIGIGGSATNDCGTGMAQALGVKFLDEAASCIVEPMTGDLMGRVSSVDMGDLRVSTQQCSFTVACDVTNPLLGPNGAASVYAPQKGADTPTVETLEANMKHVIELIEEKTGKRVRDVPGTGAAGGLGAGLMAFLDAKLQPGVEIVMRYSRFAEKIRSADLIITGEGRIDATTASGKTISGIAASAAENAIPVVALAGAVGPHIENVMKMGLKVVLPISTAGITKEQSMKNAARLLADAAEQLVIQLKY